MAKDYYAILGTEPKASEKEVRQAYRRLARQHHPDVNPGDKAAENKFKEINEAYEVLSDSEKRKKYDRFGENWKYADQLSQGGSTGDGSSIWSFGSGSPFGRGSNGFEDQLGSILGEHRFGHTVTSTRRRARREHRVEVTLAEAFSGTTRVIQVAAAPNGGGRRLEVTIPPGVDNGSHIRVRSEGVNSEDELYLITSVKPDARFQRRGEDLYTHVDVPLLDAVLGGEVEAPTIEEKVALKVPPETQNGRSFRLSGKGMPRLSSPQTRGSLYVILQVRIPSHLTERERELFRELKTLQSHREE
jgi:curved DNA-binding protein